MMKKSSRGRYRGSLRKRGYEVSFATDQQQAWQLFETKQPSFYLVDYRLGKGDGLGLLGRMKAARPQTNVV